MSAAAAARDTNKSQGWLKSYLMKGSTTIYKGTLVHIASGYVIPGADTSGNVMVGVAHETKTNSGADGAVSILVEKTGEFEFVASSAAQSWVGVAVYAVDDQTVALAATTTNDVLAGYVQELTSASAVRVRIDRAVL